MIWHNSMREISLAQNAGREMNQGPFNGGAESQRGREMDRVLKLPGCTQLNLHLTTEHL